MEGRVLELEGMAVLMGVGVGRSEGLYGGGCDNEGLGGVAAKDGHCCLESFSSSNRAKLVA